MDAGRIRLGRLPLVVASSLAAALVPVALPGLTNLVAWSVWFPAAAALIASVPIAFVRREGSLVTRALLLLVLVAPAVVIASLGGFFVGWSEPLVVRLAPYALAALSSGFVLARGVHQERGLALLALALTAGAGLVDFWLFGSVQMRLYNLLESLSAKTVYAASTWTALWIGLAVAMTFCVMGRAASGSVSSAG